MTYFFLFCKFWLSFALFICSLQFLEQMSYWADVDLSWDLSLLLLGALIHGLRQLHVYFLAWDFLDTQIMEIQTINLCEGRLVIMNFQEKVCLLIWYPG